MDDNQNTTEEKPLVLEADKFYRNKIGKVIFITAEVPAWRTKLYNKGYRFVDHRGTFYSETGSVMSGLWKMMDLTEEVLVENVAADEILEIANAFERRRKKAELNRDFIRFMDKIQPILAGVNLTGGWYMIASRAFPITGFFCTAVGVWGVYDHMSKES